MAHNDDKYSVDQILEDAEKIKVKIIKRESEQRSKSIGEKMSIIRSNMEKELEADYKHKSLIKKFIPKDKLKVEDIYSNTSSKIKLKVTNPLDILPLDDPENTEQTIQTNNKIQSSSKTQKPTKEPTKDSKPQPINDTTSVPVKNNKTKSALLTTESPTEPQKLTKTVQKNSNNSTSKLKDKNSQELNLTDKNNIESKNNSNKLKKVVHSGCEEIATYKRALKNSQNKSKKSQDSNKKEDIDLKINQKRTFLFNNKKDYLTDNNLQENDELLEYTCSKDIESIKKDNLAKCKKSLIQTLILFITMLISVIPPILLRFFPSIFQKLSTTNINLIYSSINLGASILCIIVCFSIVKNGLKGILHLKGNIYSAVSISIILTLIQSAISFINLNRFGESKGQISIFTGIAVIYLFFITLGELYKSLTIRNNFAFISSSSQKYSLKEINDEASTAKITDGLNLKNPIISYQKKAEFLSNFLHISYSPDPADSIAYYSAPITLALSFLISIIVLIMKKEPFSFISTFTLISCMSIPVSLSFSINNLLYKVCRRSLKQHSMISGYRAIQQFSNVNTIIVDENELFPAGSINMIGLKTFSALRLDESILCAAAVINSIGIPMKHIFDDVIKKKRNLMPNVSEVKYTQGLGLTSWANGKRILIGNRDLLKAHGISAPPMKFELSYRKKGYEITYFAKGGNLVAAFILSYTAEKNIKSKLAQLEEIGVNIIVKTSDHNITKDFIANKFNLFPENIKILSEKEVDLCNDIYTSSDISSPAYIATKGKLSSFLYIIESCKKLKINISIASIIQIISLILGVIIVSMISIYPSGVESIGFFEIFIYIVFWSLSIMITTKIKRPQQHTKGD